MDKKRLEIIITSVLIVVFVLLAANSCKVLKKRKAPAAPSKPQASQQGLAAPQEKNQPAAKPDAASTQQLQWGRDPFSNKVYITIKESKDAAFQVSGIVWDKDKPTAIINNKVCEIGSRVGNFTVMAIRQDRVILSDGFQVIEKRIGK